MAEGGASISVCDIPAAAVLWTSNSYTDLRAWYSFHVKDAGDMVPTKFADNRLLFLDNVPSPPCGVFDGVLNKDFDNKCWTKHGCSIIIEGDSVVFIKFSNIDSIVTYRCAQRLPVIPKTWKPIVFNINNSIYAVRLTNDMALIFSKGASTGASGSNGVFNISPVDYNKGFCCVHPLTNQAFLYGSYVVPNFTQTQLASNTDLATQDINKKSVVKLLNDINNNNKANNVQIIPFHSCNKGCWGFIVNFYPWGSILVPKEVEVSRLSSGSTMMCGVTGEAAWNTAGFIFIPPNITLKVNIILPKSGRKVYTYGTNYGISVFKETEYAYNVYVLLDGELCVYKYSYDIRINKPDSSCVVNNIAIRLEAKNKKEAPDVWTIANTKEIVRVLIPVGGPVNGFGHLVNKQLVAVFDGEVGQYSTNYFGTKLTNAFIAPSDDVGSSGSSSSDTDDNNLSHAAGNNENGDNA